MIVVFFTICSIKYFYEQQSCKFSAEKRCLYGKDKICGKCIQKENNQVNMMNKM